MADIGADTTPVPSARVERIATRGLSLRYGRKFALYKAALDIRRDEPCVIMGPNGSGKSTLFGLLSGLKRPTDGTVEHLDRQNRRLDPVKVFGLTGLMSHLPMTYGELSGYENIRLFVELAGQSDPDVRTRKAIKTVNLDPDDNRATAAYSHGMRRRLALARVLAVEPQVMILDEPDSGLDRRSRQDIAAVLNAHAGGRLLLFSSHNPEFVAAVARQVVVLSAGRVVLDKRSERFKPEDVARLYSESTEPKVSASAGKDRTEPAGN